MHNILHTLKDNLQKYFQYRKYSCRMPAIIQRARNKDKKCVVFFAISVSMWKSNELFSLLMNDPEFDPIIVSYLYPSDSEEYQNGVQSEMRQYFGTLGFPYIDSYNFNTRTRFDVHTLNPDIIFYAQPYWSGYPSYLVTSFWDKCLFGYIPYCLNLEIDPLFYSGLYLNICWKVYSATEYNKSIEGKLLYNKGRNIVAVGHPLFDTMDAIVTPEYQWKVLDPSVKRFIWAPHHSILESDELNYSTFLDIAEQVLSLTKEYNGRAQFAFKPHPRLKTKLYSLNSWGVEKTDWFYNQWRLLPNTVLWEGDYANLFLSSDAMFHDSASFTCEYLYTEKPVMFLTKDPEEHKKALNDFGKDCFELHYMGASIDDIRSFVDNVICDIDPRKNERILFKNNTLKTGSKDRVSDRIYNDLKKSLQ